MCLNRHLRYQVGITLNQLYPRKVGICACGCGRPLLRSRKKWFSDECRDTAYINFAIIKGDSSIIRNYLYLMDQGACRECGLISNTWEADHILPVNKGGAACNISNLQTLCVDCHQKKTAGLIDYPIVRLFHHKHHESLLDGISLQTDKHQIAV